MDPFDNELSIGIDLGTTFSCVGIWRQNKVEIVADENGSHIIPSMVSFNGQDRLIGMGAFNKAAANAKNTVFDAKRLIGRKVTEAEVQEDIKLYPFKVIGDKENRPQIEVMYNNEKKQFYPEQISAMIIGKIMQNVQKYTEQQVKKAVITVPAYFNDSQRKSTKDAAEIAGLEVQRIINEPTAAALAYGLNQDLSQSQNVLIFDLGGGTFDVSVLTLDNGIFQVVATGGDTHLGGQDFDSRMVKYIRENMESKLKIDIGSNPKALRRLRTKCESVKRQLSTAYEAVLEYDLGDDDYEESITRSKFESLCEDLFQKCTVTLDQVLKDSKLNKYQIDEVVMVGGSTRIPKVREIVKGYFEGKQLNDTVNPDEAVAYGATVQSAILNGQVDDDTDIVLLDVTPLSLGIETVGNKMSNIIVRNTQIPAQHEKCYTTVADNQSVIDIVIFEGERIFVTENHKLGQFEIKGIKPEKAGEPKIKVKFEIDSNGILHVTATDEKNTSNQESVRIVNDKDRLTPEEIQKLIEDAKQFNELDKVRADAMQM